MSGDLFFNRMPFTQIDFGLNASLNPYSTSDLRAFFESKKIFYTTEAFAQLMNEIEW